jgi:dihydropyrimidinase
VVQASGTREADVVVREGRIAALESWNGPGRDAETVDAEGCVILPGGIDPHTHPLHDLRAATASALQGGTTTILAFTLPRPGETPAAAWRRAQADDLPKALTDVRLHPSIWEPDQLGRADLQELAELGARSVKLFLAYPELGMMASDRTLYETLRDATELGLLTMVHCENGGAIEALVAEELAAGRTDLAGFVRSRPPDVEEEAVARVLHLAGLARASVYLVHLSSAGSIPHVREARRRGQTVWAEACTHHLLLDASLYERPDALRWLTAPPLRDRHHVDSLWEAIADGTIDAVGSDHAQLAYVPDIETDDFRSLPFGFAGVGMRVPGVLSEGTRRQIPLERLASLLASAPARAFALPDRGAIEEGLAADLIVWDPESEWTAGVGDGVYEGLAVRGSIRTVVRAGRVMRGIE